MSITGTINGQSRAQSFTYDDVGRLVTATGWEAWQRRFDYDRWGNRTGVWDATVGGTQIQSIGLQQQAGSSPGAPSNRMQTMTQVGSTLTQQYDAAGNLINDGVHAYRYDAEGRLVKVDASTANEAVYSYDANNWRVKKLVGGVTTYYIWEGAVVIAEYSTTTPQGSGGLKFYHRDQLSTRMITDASGVVKGTQGHLPFGEDAGTFAEVEKHAFTGYERDSESGTDYAVNRQYYTNVGRFMQPDPVAGSYLDPQTLNRYTYVGNNPVNRDDRTGLMPGDQHQYITFILAALLGKPDAIARGRGAGAADNFVNATTGLFGFGYIANFSKHFGIPASITTLRGLSGFEFGFAAHLVEDNGPGGPHQTVAGYGLGRRILSSLKHIFLNLIGKSPDTDPNRQVTYLDVWLGMNGPPEAFPEAAVGFITSFLNSHHLRVVGAVVELPNGKVVGDFESDIKNLAGIKLISRQTFPDPTFGSVEVRIWQLPGKNFYDDPNVQAIMRAFSYPGSNAVDESYAIYLYQLSLAGFPPGVGGWLDFNTWFYSLETGDR